MTVTTCVLVADDQPDVIDALRLMLKAAGFDADSASSIESVRERLASKRYDLLLMDLNYARDTTSGREGLDLLAELRMLDPMVPVVVMTAADNAKRWAEEVGADGYVVKPFELPVAAEVVVPITYSALPFGPDWTAMSSSPSRPSPPT